MVGVLCGPQFGGGHFLRLEWPWLAALDRLGDVAGITGWAEGDSRGEPPAGLAIAQVRCPCVEGVRMNADVEGAHRSALVAGQLRQLAFIRTKERGQLPEPGSRRPHMTKLIP